MKRAEVELPPAMVTRRLVGQAFSGRRETPSVPRDYPLWRSPYLAGQALISLQPTATIRTGVGARRARSDNALIRDLVSPYPIAASCRSRRVGAVFMASAVRTLRIVISSEPRLLHVLRGVVIYRAKQAGFSDSDADCLAMAISEAASNVIRHTLGNRHDDRFGLEVNTYPDRMEFILEDTGPKVQPESIQPRSLEDVRPGGLGTYFIKCFVDASFYDESFLHGNRLKLVKYLSPKASDIHESAGPDHG